jgi:hypothetical protein
VRCDRIAELWDAAGLTAGPLSSVLEARYEVVAYAGAHQLWLPRDVEPKLVSSATRVYGREDLLARHGAATAFELAFPPLDGARLARLVVHDIATDADLLDSGAAEPERRLIVVDENGDDLLREPGSVIATPAGSFELVMLWPRVQLDHGAQWLLVRASDETGHVVDRLLFQAARKAP